jgi:hypothetical protein
VDRSCCRRKVGAGMPPCPTVYLLRKGRQSAYGAAAALKSGDN